MPNQSECEFYVGVGVSLSGATISIDGTARIDGSMDGTIKAGHLIVGESGQLKGEIVAETAVIEGRAEQTLSVAKLLTIKSSGLVQGTVVKGELQCYKGGRVIGVLSTNTNVVDTAGHTVVSLSD